MNLPNKITTFRVVAIPFFIFFFLTAFVPGSNYIALAIFIVACISDAVDGHIARKYNLVTNFGKFMDPLADKLLVCSALICFVALGRIPAVAVIIIIAREFAISGFRLIAAEAGIVLAASYWGKVKTTVQMIMCILLMIHLDLAWFAIIENVFIWAAVALTVISLCDYIFKNRTLLTKK